MSQTAPAGVALRAKPGFLDGLKAFFGGCSFIAQTPGTWGLAMVPMGIALFVTSLLSALAAWQLPGFIEGLLGQGESTAFSILSGALQAISVILAILISFVVGFGVAQSLSGPALEGIVRRREAALGLPLRPETPFWTDVYRSIGSAIVGFAIAGPILFVLFLVDIFVPFGAFIAVPLKFVVLILVLAWDICDYPLSVQGVPIRARIGFISRYLWPIAGFAFALALLSLMPCLLLIALPAGVAGATRLIHDLQAWAPAGADLVADR